MDSRTSSILFNLDLKNISSKLVANQYSTSKEQVEEAQQEKGSSYRSLRETVKESYLAGPSRFGNNFTM